MKESELIKEKVQANAQQQKLAIGVLKTQLDKEFLQKILKRYLKKLVQGGRDGEKA